MSDLPTLLAWLKAHKFTTGALASVLLVVFGFFVTPISKFYSLGWYLWIGIPGMVIFGILALTRGKQKPQRVAGGISLGIGIMLLIGILLLILIGIAVLVYFFSLLGK